MSFGGINYRNLMKAPNAIFAVSGIIILISLVIAILLPSERFVVAAGFLGDKWSLIGIVGVAASIVLVNMAVYLTSIARDKIFIWIISAAALTVSLGALIKVASVAYFW